MRAPAERHPAERHHRCSGPRGAHSADRLVKSVDNELLCAKKPGRVRHIAQRAPASSFGDSECYSEALKASVPRGAHGVRVGDQLIETQVGDVDDLAEREASLAGGGVLDAAPARG